MKRRCDSVVYNRAGNPALIAEYKSPAVAITQKVFEQISRYNMVLRVDYLMVSNGLKHYCVRMDYDAGTYSFLTDIPDYSQL